MKNKKKLFLVSFLRQQNVFAYFFQFKIMNIRNCKCKIQIGFKNGFEIYCQIPHTYTYILEIRNMSDLYDLHTCDFTSNFVFCTFSFKIILVIVCIYVCFKFCFCVQSVH